MKQRTNLILFTLSVLLSTQILAYQLTQEKILVNYNQSLETHRNLQLFASSSSLDCASCYAKSQNASYCLTSSTTEYCCSSNDTSSACQSSSSRVCSPTRWNAGNIFYTYCKGAANYKTCGVNDLELTADANLKSVTVSKLPYYSIVSNSINYLSCYYHISAKTYTWKDGSKLNFYVKNAKDVQFYLYGGNSRTNASINITVANASLSNKVYQIDVSTDVIVVVLPKSNVFSNNSYEFVYYISGTQYSWWEKLIIGPNGTKYFIIALVCAGVTGAAIIIGLILGIYCCCKKKNAKNQVQNAPYDKQNTSLDQTNRGLANVNDHNDINVKVNDMNRTNPPLEAQGSYGHLNGPVPGGYYGNENKPTDSGKPVIKKYDGPGPLQQNKTNGADDYYQNPFLPQNIQKNKDNNLPPVQPPNGQQQPRQSVLYRK